MSTQQQSGASVPANKYDQNFTQNVIDTCGPSTSPRFKQIFASAVRHLHDFTREVELTPEEWLEGVTFFNQVGKIWAESNGKRNEMHRMCDLVGLES
jgi:catechol 1,2-dioxygenase